MIRNDLGGGFNKICFHSVYIYREFGFIAAGSVIAIALTLRRFGRRGIVGGHGLSGARRTLARYAAALFVIDAAYGASTAATPLLIGAFLGPKAVGLFQAPSRLIVLLQYPGISVGSGVGPSMARGEGREPNVGVFSAALRYMIVFQAVLVAPVLVWSGPIVDLALGSKYGESARLLRILTPYVYMSGLSALVALAANFLGLARRRVAIAVADLVVSGALTAALLPTLGLDGAAWASDVVPLFYVPAHLWIINSVVDLPLRSFVLAGVRGLTAAGAMALVLLAFGTSHLTPLEWIGGGAFGLAAFVATLIVTGELTVGELRQLPRALAGLRRSR